MERYEKVRVIGQGAFGKVFLCRRRADRYPVVIKQIPVDELESEERRSAVNEVNVLAMLKHPNIVAYYDNFMEDKSLMIAMEYAPGGTLYEFIQERNKNPLDEEHILQLFVQILVAIQHVHSLNILHRDLKTQNIMLNKKRSVVKIGDFGISKVLSSKITSAQTVVGTPCYISPEICEGRVYRKKSDIWALGCILYELTVLKKAFEGPNLPALVLKIMKAAAEISPIPSRYSEGLRDLINSMLQRNPDDRPDIENIMANPVVVNILVNLGTDVGRLPCTRHSSRCGRGSSALGTRMGSLGSYRQRSFLEDDYHPTRNQMSHTHQPKPLVYMWGGGVSIPMVLSQPPESRITGVAVGRSHRAGITEDGKLIFWELSSGSLATTHFTMQSRAQAKEPIVFQPRLVEGLSSLVIKKVACGDLFTACLTDKGILMTFGSGMNGSLGHGNTNDVAKPKLVEQMLQYETVDVACGSNHVVAITSDHSVHAWGKGESGQLGLGTQDSHCSPQLVPLQGGTKPTTVFCGTDCTVIITNSGAVLGTGSNRHNKLGLDPVSDLPPLSNLSISSASSSTCSSSSTIGPASTCSSSSSTIDLSDENLHLGVENSDDDADTPAILKLAGNLRHVDLSRQSFIMSSFLKSHGSEMANGPSTGAKTTDVVASQETVYKNGDLVPSVSRHIDKVSSFCLSGSELLQEKVVTAALGTNHSAFVKASGACITCGANTYGQLGYQRQPGVTSPTIVNSLGRRQVKLASCGDSHTIAVTGGAVFSWGRGKRGRLGIETEEDCFEPQPIITFESSRIDSLASSHGITLLISTELS